MQVRLKNRSFVSGCEATGFVRSASPSALMNSTRHTWVTACSEMNEIKDDSQGDERKGLVTQNGLEGLFSQVITVLKCEYT